MKNVLNFSSFLLEADLYDKELEKDLVKKNAKNVATGEEQEEEQEEVDAAVIADDDDDDDHDDDEINL